MPTIFTLFSQNMYMQSFLFSMSVSNSTNFLDNRVIEISIDLYEQYFTELSLLQKNQNRQTFHSPQTCPQMQNGTDSSTRDLIIRGRQSKNHLNVDLFISLETSLYIQPMFKCAWSKRLLNKISAHQRISPGMLEAISGLTGDAFGSSTPLASSGALKCLTLHIMP